MTKLSSSELVDILNGIKALCSGIRWKANSAERHLLKRKLRGHLSQTAVLNDYEQIILTTLQDKSSQVYRYWYSHSAYVAILATVASQQWLVMFSYDGIMESAFVVERPELYLSKPGFEYIGLLSEVSDEL